MHTSIVMGSYSFIGYYVTKHLLERGEAVIGLDWDECQDSFKEEKELEIGRNSNFSYVSKKEMSGCLQNFNGDIYISGYELYHSGSESEAHEKIMQIEEIIEETGKQCPIIMILPAWTERMNYIDKFPFWGNRDRKIIFLPTVYGPWQPEYMSFQAAISGKTNQEVTEILSKEYCREALYIEDIMCEFAELLKTEAKVIYVSGKQENSWRECAKLVMEEAVYSNLINRSDAGISGQAHFCLKSSTTPREGIDRQTEHYHKIQQILKWKQ
ncbi:hypothetical protein [Bacillus massiliglaciei]|uniref:hypothetical protein n=1 Tax=Bacillus massiliglaciei TaxID=1816693 RepID=UPI000DA5FBCF|nr:hypothetical protein [Bacillus massiliglaciei]